MVEFSSDLSAIYMKWCTQTFLPIFDHDFAKIVAPPSDENENYVVHLKEQSSLKKTFKSSSKSAYKWQRYACSNYAPLERTVLRTLEREKQTPHFRTYSHRALYDLRDTARRDHQKRWNHFLIQHIVFPTGYTEKFDLIDRHAVSLQ